jgi:membrane-bound metal-dependent hydrolase YbcI (DUF457 family)
MNEDRIVDFFIIGAVITVIVLKITNVIKISWLWLLSPIWIPFGVGCIFAFVFLIVVLIEIYIDKKEN